jgi:hypothetical protein
VLKWIPHQPLVLGLGLESLSWSFHQENFKKKKKKESNFLEI